MVNLTAAKLLTAKLLLFVALTLGPGEMTRMIQITSDGVDYQWTQGTDGWRLIEIDRPSHKWPDGSLDITKSDLVEIGRENVQLVRQIARHDWSTDSVLYLDNGDRVEKRGAKVFYTAHPGDANQQAYTILYIKNATSL